jgi:anti-sigma-K factor RskA
MTDHQWLELAGAYALGALDPAERAGFEAHLAGCTTCRTEVEALRELTALLGHGVAAAEPPPALRERVLATARQVRPIGARRGRLVPWLAAAAAVVLAVLAGEAYRAERAARQQATRALAALRDSVAARDSLLAALLSPDASTAALAATGQPPSARLFWSPSRHRVVIAVYRLPPAPAGRTYQLWAIASGRPVSLGLFNTTPDGSLRAALDVPAGLVFQVTAVTEEPAGGSPQPTQQPFLIGKLAGAD